MPGRRQFGSGSPFERRHIEKMVGSVATLFARFLKSDAMPASMTVGGESEVWDLPSE